MGDAKMQNTSEIQELNTKQHLSGYDLTTLLIRGGLSKLGLNANAKLVLTYLATCYNEKNGSVYPRVKTISESLEISERGVIRALAELTDKGCIIRSKRGRNKNVYVITNKVLNLTSNDITVRQDDTSSNDTTSLPCHEIKQHEVKEQQLKENVVSLRNFNRGAEEQTLKASSTTAVCSKVLYDLTVIPDIIKAKAESGKIRNLQGYWRSLRPQVKQEYWEQDTAEKLKIQQKAEIKKQAEIQQAKELAEKQAEQAELSKPLDEQYTREQAINLVSKLYSLNRNFAFRGIAKDLVKIYEISENEIQEII